MNASRSDVFKHYTGLSLESFYRDYRGKKPFVSTQVAEGLPGLLSWDDVNDVLELSLQMGEKIQLVKEDVRIDRRHFTSALNKNLNRVQPTAVRRAMQDGHSILLDRIDSYFRPARGLADAFMNILGEEAGINAYISWKTDKCFKTHWDDHDVFIFQTAGEKEWSIFDPTRISPTEPDIEYHRADPPREDLKLWWQGVVKPGMVLYIPRGWWHHAKSTGAGSIHMTLGFYNRVGADFLKYVVSRALEHETFRRDMARPEDPAMHAEQATGFRQAVMEYVDAFFSDDGLAQFWRHHFASMSPRLQSHLPMTLSYEDFVSGENALQIASLAPIVPMAKGDQSCLIEIGGRRFDLSIEAYDLLRLFADGQSRSSKDVAGMQLGGLDEERTYCLMFELLNEGILNVARTSRMGHA